MQQTCHRCHSTVSREDAFCPVCGAPQLNFDAAEQAAFNETGELSETSSRPGHINWKVVLGACAKAAVPAGVLCALPVLSAGSLLWVFGAATAVILLYRRRKPLTVLSTRSGFRIGVLTGLIIAYVSLGVSALIRVLQRFPMHLGRTIDDEYDQLIHQSMTVFLTSPDTQAQMRPFFHYMLTPDGRATWSLMNMATITIFIVFLASIGGAVSVRLSMTRRTA